MWQIGDISEEWLKAHSSPAPEILEEIENYTRANHPSAAHMLSGYSQGRLLAMFSSMLQPERILEIGTFTGYGSICLAEGLSENGILFTLEKNPEYARVADGFFKKHGIGSKIQMLSGNATELIFTLEENWDLVYLDADKTANRNYLLQVWPKLRKGGLIIIDNIFARGGIFKADSEQRAFEKEVKKLNQDLPGLFRGSSLVILPVRDGLSILRKTN